jgi:hypothetical protein
VPGHGAAVLAAGRQREVTATDAKGSGARFMQQRWARPREREDIVSNIEIVSTFSSLSPLLALLSHQQRT